MLGQVCPAVDAAVGPVAPGQIAAEGFGGEVGGGGQRLTAGHDRLQKDALPRRRRGGCRAAPTQAVAREATEQAG